MDTTIMSTPGRAPLKSTPIGTRMKRTNTRTPIGLTCITGIDTADP
jgi:hypothetical protein